MRSPCLHCKHSKWAHSHNDYNLPTFLSCEAGTEPESEKACDGLELMQKGVIDLINDNVKKYHAKGRT